MSGLNLTSFEHENDQVIKATYQGQHSGPKTQLSFNINLTILPNGKPEERVSASIDFDGKCSAEDIPAAMNKVGTWCERIAETLKDCKPEGMSIPLSME
jgi:hypothetical protein